MADSPTSRSSAASTDPAKLRTSIKWLRNLFRKSIVGDRRSHTCNQFWRAVNRFAPTANVALDKPTSSRNTCELLPAYDFVAFLLRDKPAAFELFLSNGTSATSTPVPELQGCVLAYLASCGRASRSPSPPPAGEPAQEDDTMSNVSSPQLDAGFAPTSDEGDCFLCQRAPTTSNPVATGNMSDLTQCWARHATKYQRLYPHFRCPSGASNHTHCRAFLRTMVPGDCTLGLDAMARCYPVQQLYEYFAPGAAHKTHRRCRGGLLSLLRLVAVAVNPSDVAPPATPPPSLASPTHSVAPTVIIPPPVPLAWPQPPASMACYPLSPATGGGGIGSAPSSSSGIVTRSRGVSGGPMTRTATGQLKLSPGLFPTAETLAGELGSLSLDQSPNMFGDSSGDSLGELLGAMHSLDGLPGLRSRSQSRSPEGGGSGGGGGGTGGDGAAVVAAAVAARGSRKQSCSPTAAVAAAAAAAASMGPPAPPARGSVQVIAALSMPPLVPPPPLNTDASPRGGGGPSHGEPGGAAVAGSRVRFEDGTDFRAEEVLCSLGSGSLLGVKSHDLESFSVNGLSGLEASTFSFDFGMPHQVTLDHAVIQTALEQHSRQQEAAAAARTAAVKTCRVCGVPCPDVSIQLLKRLSDTKLVYEGLESEFASCVTMQCPGGRAAGDANGHVACRAAFSRRFYAPLESLDPHVHCCWDLDRVKELFQDGESVACGSCCDALSGVVKALASFRERAMQQQRMVEYLTRVVWPGVAQDRVKVLRLTLHGAPYKVRSPEDLVEQGARTLDSVLTRLAHELEGRGMETLQAQERSMYVNFVLHRCKEEHSSAFDSLTSGLPFQPPTKIRHVG